MNVLKLGTLVKDFIAQLNANFSELSGKLTYNPVSFKVLYSGTTEIPSASSGNSVNVTVNTNLSNFDGLIFVRDDTDAAVFMTAPTVGTVFKVVNKQADFDLMGGMNLFGCNATIVNNTTIKLNNNVYSGVKENASGRYMNSFSDVPLKKIIGIKLN